MTIQEINDTKPTAIERQVSNVSKASDPSFVKQFFRSISAVSKSFSDQVEIQRPIYTLDHFDEEYGFENKQPSITKWAKEKLRKQCVCSKKRLISIIYSFLPFLTWVPKYKWKADGVRDVLAGITIGIMSIPQGMAYSRLAGIPAVYGLYTNVIPTFLYFFFGTSQLGAIGTVSVISLMVGITRYKLIPVGDYSIGCVTLFGNNSSTVGLEEIVSSNSSCYSSWDLAIATSMLSGLLMLLMGFLRFGFVSYYLSDQLVGGFTAGAAVFVFTSEIDVLFGLELDKHGGPGNLFSTYYDLFSKIRRANVTTLVGSIICIAFLLISKELLDPLLQKRFKLRVPIPGELIVVIAGTIVSLCAKLNTNYDVSIVGTIPSGFPAPKIPRFDIMNQIFVDSLILAIVNYSLSVSLAKLYANRNNYKIDPYQEFFAYGIINVIGNCFHCYPSGQSVARSIVYESAGAKSQFAAVIGTICVILTIYFIAPFLSALPQYVLGAIIVVACVEMLKQLKELKTMFSNSKFDFSIYLVTFLAVIFLDITYGLAVGVLYAFLTVIFRTQCPHVQTMGHLPETDLYGEVDYYRKAEQMPNIKVFSYNAPLYYANVESFRPKLYKKCNVDPTKIKAQLLEEARTEAKNEANKTKRSREQSVDTGVQSGHSSQIESHDFSLPSSVDYYDSKIKFVVIDCSGFVYVDFMGVNVLKQVFHELQDVGVTVYYADCNAPVRRTLQSAGFYDTVPKCNMFVTVHDAVTAALRAIGLFDSLAFHFSSDYRDELTEPKTKFYISHSDESSGVSTYEYESSRHDTNTSSKANSQS